MNKPTRPHKKFVWKNEALAVTVGPATYEQGRRPLVQVYETTGRGSPWGILSVNLPEQNGLLGEHEFFAKTWSENEGWAEAALKAGIFTDTGVRVRTGFCEAQIWSYDPTQFTK